MSGRIPFVLALFVVFRCVGVVVAVVVVVSFCTLLSLLLSRCV